MKKLISLVLLFTIALSGVAFASPKTKTGTEPLVAAGDLLSTDIKTYINERRIISYNVNGYTALIAEDLLKYGFKVDWDSSARLLTISKPDFAEFFGEEIYDDKKMEIGKKIGTAYHTDIRTVVEGVTVLSYNIGGKTAIFTDALRLFGDVAFDGDERAVYCEIPGLTYKKPSITITDPDEENEEVEEEKEEEKEETEESETVEVPVPKDEKEEETVEVPVPKDEKDEETDVEKDDTTLPEEPETSEKEGYYSNGIVPDYTDVTGVHLKEKIEKSNDYISYTYDNFDEVAPDKYIKHISENEDFVFNKESKGKNDTTVYYYVKGNLALAIEIDSANNLLTITCKK